MVCLPRSSSAASAQISIQMFSKHNRTFAERLNLSWVFQHSWDKSENQYLIESYPNFTKNILPVLKIFSRCCSLLGNNDSSSAEKTLRPANRERWSEHFPRQSIDFWILVHISQKHADQIGLNTHGQVWDIFLERTMKNLVTSLLNRHLLLIFLRRKEGLKNKLRKVPLNSWNIWSSFIQEVFAHLLK